jgi:DNA-binding beta-propeller fold protein YncE
VRPDGGNVYASTYTGNVLAFSRNATSGALTPIGCHTLMATPGCSTLSGSDGSLGVAMDADGKDVYVTGQGGAGTTGGLSVLHRNFDGTLNYNQCFFSAGTETCATVPALVSANRAAVSHDGKNVYVVANASTIAVFGRNTGTGSLIYNSCFRSGGGSGCSAAGGINGAHGVAVSPDGASVYVAASAGAAIARFDRAVPAGTLTPVACVSRTATDGCTAETGLARMETVAVSADSNDVYAVGSDLGFSMDNLGTLIAFTRTPTGALTKRGCLADNGVDGCAPGTGLKGAQGVSISPGGENVYVAANASGTGSNAGGVAAVLAREVAPICTGGGVTVAFQGSATIPLTCTDANGDALTRSIVNQPQHGTLGAIDGTSNTILYTAAHGYTGPDSFVFKASDPDFESGLTTQLITVSAPVRCRVPKLRGKTLKGARKALKQRHCRLGKVTKPRKVHSKRAIAKLVVKKQSPRAGKVRPRGTRVKVTLGKKRPAKKR